jgi:hypothetical protein
MPDQPHLCLRVMHSHHYPFRIERHADSEVAFFASGDSHDLHALLSDLARRARRATHPNKSMAATLRQRRLTLTSSERNALFDLALELLACIDGGMAAREWLTVSEAARHLDQSVHEVMELLETSAGRRELGWPWRLGDIWRIPAAAIYADTRACYMASLPEQDPYLRRI